MKTKLSLKVKVVQDLLGGKIKPIKATSLLGCSKRALRRYKKKFAQNGPRELRDNRHSNYHKLTGKQKVSIRQKKKEGPWRSARWIRDHLSGEF